MKFIRYLSYGLLSFCFMSSANAAQVGTVTINGTVPQVCDILVTPAVGASNIADISIGDTNRQIATVNENCNDTNGYTVTMVGTNSGNHTGLFIDSVSHGSQPFTIAYNGTNLSTGGIVTNVTAPGINLNRPVTITYSPNSALPATTGFTYAETLTFTIAPK